MINSNSNRESIKTGLYAAVVVFLAYTMIFGFRKSFTVTTFEGLTFAGYSYKILLVISQMLGYLLAKFYGIKFISELKRTGRGQIIMILTGFAWLCWLFFAITPAPYNIIFLFLNGFPLGMLWGVVFSYVEGRRTTDFIGATLAVSFIFASGFVKSVGAWLMVEFGVSEFWVPFYTGLVFCLPLLIFIYFMEKIPAPNAEDEKFRTARLPMTPESRKAFIKHFLGGIIACTIIYAFATIFRDIRDNFSAEMWKEMGFYNQPSLFSKTETPITLIVLALIGSMVFLKNNFKAFRLTHYFIIAGFIIAGGSSYLFQQQLISPFVWMTVVGLGLYMVYIPFNAVYFERLLASFKYAGNVGFLIYIVDSFAYVGSIGVLFSKEIFKIDLNWVNFYSSAVIYLSFIGVFVTAYTLWYFSKKHKESNLS